MATELFLSRKISNFLPLQQSKTSMKKIPPNLPMINNALEGIEQMSRNEIRGKFARAMKESFQYVKSDIRDEWHTEITPEKYATGDLLFEGRYSSVVTARSYPAFNGFTYVEPRPCIIKTKHIGAILDDILRDQCDVKETFQQKIFRLLRRIVMEVYILNRVRHSNIMHAHATVVTEHSLCLQLVLPRLYQLEQLIDKYRHDKEGKPMNICIIAMIIRQLCRALSYLHDANIIHNDIQPENIYLTRGGTVKLSNFINSRMIVNEQAAEMCRTPDGTPDYMCAEKQYNLKRATIATDYKNYSTSADIWSLGVLILHMVSYYPNERWHRLPRMFALQMGERRMPFRWMINDMMQLCIRMTQCGDGRLKQYLNDTMLNLDPSARPTARQILESYLITKWCNKSLEQDKNHLVKRFIYELDWQNRSKLDADGYNYNACEAKDIPADFYWDDTWQKLEKQSFAYRLYVYDHDHLRIGSKVERYFTHADNSLFQTLMLAVDANHLEMFDVIPVDQNIRNLCFLLIRSAKYHRYNLAKCEAEEVSFDLPPSFHCDMRSAKTVVYFKD
ncbi:NEK protein kinase [Loa loa]|uniref:NEK protein kinase n=1 Tax=Loa loa TaxID=7209 RepID=A0A1I7V7X6_LOALO|nr:NEK protein kinase [Loa loa]EFO21206.1 NEK protein kinase [Loa loa]